MGVLETDILSIWCTCIYDSLVMSVICFVYVVKHLEHLIKMNMALYRVAPKKRTANVDQI